MSLQLDANVLASAINDTDTPSAARLGAVNILRASEATVTASASPVGGEKENAYAEGFNYDFWRPGSGIQWLRASFSSSQKVNYLGIAAHDLHNVSASIKLQESSDGSVWTDVTGSDYTPTTSAPIFIEFSEEENLHFRLYISGSTSTPNIGAVNFGCALKMDGVLSPGYTPPHQALADRHLVERAEGGAFLGRSLIASGAILNAAMTGCDMDWIRAHWESHVRLLEQYPFFWVAGDEGKIDARAYKNSFYGWVSSQPGSTYANRVYGSLGLNARGIVT